MRTKTETAILQLVPQGVDFLLDFAARQAETQVAQAGVEQAFVGPAGPGDRCGTACLGFFAPPAVF
jgi:hypothetical protein